MEESKTLKHKKYYVASQEKKKNVLSKILLFTTQRKIYFIYVFIK